MYSPYESKSELVPIGKAPPSGLGYYSRYSHLAYERDIVNALAHQRTLSRRFLESISEEDSAFSYARNKWSIREVVGHLIDAERSFALHALSLARGMTVKGTHLSHLRTAHYHQRSWLSLCFELRTLRDANLISFRTFSVDLLAVEHDGLRVDAILRALLGHERHHLNKIERVYLQRK